MENSTGNDRRQGKALLWIAALLLLALAAAQGYVSWQAQFSFIDAAKHARLPSTLEALGLDTGAVVFAVLGLAHARMGRQARIERTLNIACALGSLTMNLLGANLTSPRSVAVFVLPAVLYAAGSDRLIATAAVVAGVPEASLWRCIGRVFLFGLRLVVAFPSTARGLRQRLLDATPLPAPGAPRQAAPGSTPAALPTATPEVLPEPAPESTRPRSQKRPRSRPQGRSRKPVTEADAELEFIDEPIPSIREIRRRLPVGEERAKKLLAHLQSVAATSHGDAQ